MNLRRITPALARSLCFKGACLSALGFLAIFLLLPSDLADAVFGTLAPKVVRKQPLGLFAAGTVSLCLFAFFRLFDAILSPGSRRTAATRSAPSQAAPGWLRTASVGLAFGVFVNTAIDVKTRPLELNELTEIGRIQEGQYSGIERFPRIGHLISTQLARVSMFILGYDRIGSRLPSLFFLAGFLALLLWGFGTAISPGAMLLVMLHIGVNPLLRVYMGSMRGYMAGLFFSTLLLCMVVRWVRAPMSKDLSRWLPLFFLFPVFANFFSGIFSIILFLAVLYWLQSIRHTLPWAELEKSTWTVVGCALVMPVVAFSIKCQSQSFTTGDPASGSLVEIVQGTAKYLPLVLGLPFRSYFWLKVCSFAFLIVATLSGKRGREPRHFLVALFQVGIALYLALSWVYRARMEERYFIEWVVPFTLLMSLAAGLVADKFQRSIALGLVFGMLFVAPLVAQVPSRQYVGVFHGYEEFMAEVRGKLPRGEQVCFSFSRDTSNQSHYLKWFAESVFFLDELELSRRSPEACLHRFHLSFGDGVQVRGQWDPELPPTSTLKPIARSKALEGTLYEVVR